MMNTKELLLQSIAAETDEARRDIYQSQYDTLKDNPEPDSTASGNTVFLVTRSGTLYDTIIFDEDYNLWWSMTTDQTDEWDSLLWSIMDGYSLRSLTPSIP